MATFFITPQETGSPATESRRLPAAALDQVEIAFIGGHNRAQIKKRLDRAMRLYDLTITEENYSRAGSALVALRKQNGVSEMEILDYMIEATPVEVAVAWL